VLIQDFASRDVQVGSGEPGFVIERGMELDEHSVFDWAKKLSMFAGRQRSLLEPVGEGEGATGFEQFGRIGEKARNVLIVRDRFDRPEEIEWLVEVHGLCVHAVEGGRGAGLPTGFVGHFDLHGRDSDADGLHAVLTSEVDAAGAEAAADVEKFCARLNAGSLSELFDELQLRDFFIRFMATDPITVVEMLAPK